MNWPGSFETFRKIPTCLLYDQTGQVIAWGIEAKNSGPMPGAIKCEWYVHSHFILSEPVRTRLSGSNYSSSLMLFGIIQPWILASLLSR